MVFNLKGTVSIVKPCTMHMHIAYSTTKNLNFLSYFMRIFSVFIIRWWSYNRMLVFRNCSRFSQMPFINIADGLLCHDLNIFPEYFPCNLNIFSLTTFPSTNTSLSTTQHTKFERGMIDTVSQNGNFFYAIEGIYSLIRGNEHETKKNVETDEIKSFSRS